jgi:ketosteroid isomerase-like protein
MESDVRDAVDRIVSAFGEGRLEDYFACFAEDATFVFYTTPRRLTSLADYRELWKRWVEEDGFQVISCDTTDTNIQRLGDVAVVTHAVETRISTRAGNDTLHERETIVLARNADGGWVAVHEHLSPTP